MAVRRMFLNKITDSDDFSSMPLGAQAIYFHFGLAADDDGFVNRARQIRLTIGASEEDLELLVSKGYLIRFEGGVFAIAHWLSHNTIRKDRYTPTLYKYLKNMLYVHNKVYVLRSQAPDCQPNGNPEEDRLEQDSIDQMREDCDISADMLKHTIQQIACGLQIPLALTDKIIEWFTYRFDQGFHPTPTTINALLKKSAKQADIHGVEEVCSLVDLSISHGWKGIYFDRLDNAHSNIKVPNKTKEIDYGSPEDYFE